MVLNVKVKNGGKMGTIFVAGVYGVGKSTLCELMSKYSLIPFFSAGDLISKVNGEQYGANKVVNDKDKNQYILANEVNKKLGQHKRIILAGHFCIFDMNNHVVQLPESVFEKLSIEKILLLEADPIRILDNLKKRDNREYELTQIYSLLKSESAAAELVSQKINCPLKIHNMKFDATDLQLCKELIKARG